MFLACLVKPQRLRGVRAAIPVAERDNGGGGGKAICGETGLAHGLAASRGLWDRDVKLEAENRASAER